MNSFFLQSIFISMKYLQMNGQATKMKKIKSFHYQYPSIKITNLGIHLVSKSQIH